MAIRHVITIRVAPGKAAELDDPDTLVLPERWASPELLERHMEAERTRDSTPMNALVALRAPGVTLTIERFEL